MNSISIDIQSYLQMRGVATLGIDMFVGNMPPTPIKSICLYDTSGGVPRDTLDGSEVHYMNGIQINVRAGTYTEAAEWAQTIIETLHGVSNTIIGGTKYLFIQLTSGPMSIGDDIQEDDLHWQIMNFQISRTKI